MEGVIICIVVLVSMFLGWCFIVTLVCGLARCTIETVGAFRDWWKDLQIAVEKIWKRDD